MQNEQINQGEEMQGSSQGNAEMGRGSQGKSLRGFAAMDPERQRAIASKGGQAAHAKGTAHEFTPEEAREAGRKGGRNSHGGGRRSNREREEMDIGR